MNSETDNQIRKMPKRILTLKTQGDNLHQDLFSIKKKKKKKILEYRLLYVLKVKVQVVSCTNA